jgi:hypothetical protein
MDLMLPTIHDWRFAKAPILKWEDVDGFDTATECHDYAADWSRLTNHSHAADADLVW